MPVKKGNISYEDRFKVIVKAELGQSHRSIAAKMKLNRKSIDSIVRKYSELGSVQDKESSGHPKKSNVRQDRALIWASLGNRRLTAPQLKEEWKNLTGVEASVSTVKSRLIAAGLKGCVATKKPLLTKANRKARFEFAMRHRDWTDSQWKKVLWSDGSAFQIFNSAKRLYVRRRCHERLSDQCVVPTVKFGGGKLMVWGARVRTDWDC